jgi:hypothetical protein
VKAKWVESVPIKEVFQGRTVWQGEVQVFSLSGHPTASCCYAWSYVTDETTGKRTSLCYNKAQLILPKLLYALRLWLNIGKRRNLDVKLEKV